LIGGLEIVDFQKDAVKTFEFENEKEDYDIDNILDKDNEKNSDERTVPMPRFGRYITEEEYENKIADKSFS
jgi:hypothetical protein